MISFLKKETLSKISSFKVSNQNLAYIKESILYLNHQEITNGTNSYFLYNQTMYFHKNSKTHNVNQNYEIRILANFAFNFESLYEGNVIIGDDIKAENLSTFEISCKYKIINISNFSIIRELPYRYSHIFGYRFKDSYLCSEITKKLIKSLSLLTGEYEWEVDLGFEGLEVGGILGIKDNHLIVACTDEQHQGIWLALDVATGKEVWRRYLQISYGGTYAFSVDKTSIFYLQAGGLWVNGKQIVRGSNIFREINTIDGSLRREGVLWQMDEAGLGIKNCTLHKGFIYFTAVYQSFGATVIGVLDYETLSLLWWEEVKMQEADGFGNFFLNQPLQVSDNKIYVLDKTNVLHIYEKDESVSFVKPTKSGLMAFEDLPIEPITPQKDTKYSDFGDLPF